MTDPIANSIRFRLGYTSPSTLLAELVRAVNRGEVVLPIGRTVPVGTRFLFEMHAPGVSPGVEVLGRVVAVTPKDQGFELTIHYERGHGRAGVDAALERLREAHRYEQVRSHPRIPFHLNVRDQDLGLHFLVRDISRGGVGVDLSSEGELPEVVKRGQMVLLELSLPPGVLALHGEVVWVRGAPGGARPGFGMRFGTLRPQAATLLEKVLALDLMPSATPSPRLSFGARALDRLTG